MPEFVGIPSVTSTEIAELAGEVMHRPATRAEQKRMAASLLAQADARPTTRQLKRAIRNIRKAIGNPTIGLDIDVLEEMLFPPRRKPKPER